MKTCSKCSVEKVESAFSKRSARKDGLQSYCKECSSKHVSQWVKENPEKARAKVDRWQAKNRDFIRDNERKRRIANPEKGMARRQVRTAVMNGTLARLPCEVCGSIKVEAHHEDYSKPLDVRWLCPPHHAQHHASIK